MSFEKETNNFGTLTYCVDSGVVSVSFCSRTNVPKMHLFAHNCLGSGLCKAQ